MKAISLPKSAKATNYFYMRTLANLYFDLTVLKTSNSCFIRICVDDGCYQSYKLDVYNAHFEGHLVELLNSEFNLNITVRDFHYSEDYHRVIKFVMDEIARHYDLVEYTKNEVDFNY